MLENKLGITDSKEMADKEERIVKKKVRELYDSDRLNRIPVGTYDGLKELHKFMFDDIYDFAGELRKVNIGKGNFRFASVLYLDNAVKFIDILPHSTFGEIIDKYVEMYIAHPFRAGNGISTRLWLDVMLAAVLGKIVDWSKVDAGAYGAAMERCSLEQADLQKVLQSALTSDMERRSFLRALDGSFALEGFSKYKAEQL